ncbi:hypothetical protein STEG23_034077, partial [Scotinomys teguina]
RNLNFWVASIQTGDGYLEHVPDNPTPFAVIGPDVISPFCARALRIWSAVLYSELLRPVYWTLTETLVFLDMPERVESFSKVNCVYICLSQQET